MSDSGRDWGASSDEAIRAFNAAKRDAKIKNTIEQLDSLYAATPQGEWSETAPRTCSIESVYCDGEMVACCCYGKRETSEPTAKFVARIHNAWPTISDELKRLRDANEMLVGALKIASADCDQLREELKGKI